MNEHEERARELISSGVSVRRTGKGALADLREAIAPKRVLVTGPRIWRDWSALRAALKPYRGIGAVLVSGACTRGFDAISEAIWKQWGESVPERHPAEWEPNGNSAGYQRNKVMVDLGADVAVVGIMDCPDVKCRRPRPHITHGTKLCLDLVNNAGIPVTEVRPSTAEH